MSHVATVEIEIKDLDVLAAAARRCGLELRKGQQTYNWWGKHVGDYPLPEGFAKQELGYCEHALHIAGEPNVPLDKIGYEHNYAYEIGICRRRDAHGKPLPGYTLLWDFIDGRLSQLVGGSKADKLRQAYAAEAAIKQARMQGFAVREQQLADGSLKLVLSK